MEKGFFPLQTKRHDDLIPGLPAARNAHFEWHHGAGPGHTLLPEQHHGLAAWKSHQTTPLQPCTPVKRSSFQPAPPHGARPRAVLGWRRAFLRAPGRRGCSCVVLVSQNQLSGQLHLRQVRQVAGLALCVMALLLWVEEVAQGVLLQGVGRLENALRWSPRHQLRTLHLSGDTNLSSQTCPITQLSLFCCRADAETHPQECLHQVLNLKVSTVPLRMLLLSPKPTMPGEHRREAGPICPNRLTGSPAEIETSKSYLGVRYNLQDVQL